MHGRMLAAVMAAMMVAGCANTDGLAARESASGFDGARVVSIDPHGVACEALPCISIGGEWNSKRPDTVLALVSVTSGEFSALRRLELNIDGRVVDVAPQAGSVSRFTAPVPAMRQSLQTFVLPLADLRAVASARRAWVRVTTLNGYTEQAIIDGATDSKAVHALRRFVAQIDAGAPK